MCEYIKREYAVDAVLDVYCDTPDIDLSCEKFEAAIRKIQAANVAPVRHGRWVDNHCTVCGMMPMGDEMWKRCDFKPPRFERFMDYCPSCGAKMMEANHETGQHLEGEAGLAVGV